LEEEMMARSAAGFLALLVTFTLLRPLAAQILGTKHPEIREAFRKDRQERKQAVLDGMDPRT
jgi:hypothetical protein